MIMTLRTMDYEGLKAALPEDARLLIWSCNTCARMCGGFGGKAAVESLANRLSEDGRTVVGAEALNASCFLSAVRKRLERPEFRKMVESATHLIPLTCITGTKLLLREMPHLQTVDVGKTIGLGFLSDTRGAVLTRSLTEELDVPAKGMTLTDAAEVLGLYIGPF